MTTPIFPPFPLPNQRPLPRMRTCFPVVLCCCLLLLNACSQDTGKKAGKKRSAIPVGTALGSSRTVPIDLGATGHVEALATVEVRSQVTGLLQTIHFQEGDEVRAGALLFTIDPRPFAADLARAKALLAKDRAELDNARRDQARYGPAAAKGLVSREQADQALTRVATLTAAIQADQAAVDSAELALDHCSIRAPFAGRTGEILNDQGNLIKANADAPMVTVNRIDPLLASFTVPGRHLQEIFTSRRHGEVPVLAEQEAGQPPLTGRLVFIDNSVDPATGAIRLKAAFANAQHRLWPGQLIDVRLHLNDRPGCVVVPSQAVQMGQNGAYLYVVRADQTAVYRPVTPGMRFQGLTIIEKGLQAGERVVIDGQMQLDDGLKVVDRGQADTGDRGKRGKP